MRASLTTVAILTALVGCSSGEPTDNVASGQNAIEAVPSFGSNPGNLKMFRYVPTGAPKGAPLVVALHGCLQNATAFETAGWSALAESRKFYMVYPEQGSNNPVGCFNWFGKYNQPSDKTNLTRGKGEPESVKQMVDKMKADYGIDPSRVYVVGFSAGAASAAVLLTLYPDVFSAGAILAGVPYNCPSTQNADVWNCMAPGKDLTAQQWGDRVRAAFPGFAGPYPRVSIWHGTKDTTVSPNNQRELVEQWTNVHGLSSPTSTETIDGQRRVRYGDLLESWEINGLGHAIPVDPGKGCGKTASYISDAKICSTSHVARFLGLDGEPPPPTDAGVDTGTGIDSGTDTGTIDSGTDTGPVTDASGDGFLETVSSGGLDRSGWSLGGWDLASVNYSSATGSQSLHARATSAMNKSAKAASITVRPAAGAHLSYARRVSLRGANVASTARFAIEIVDGATTTTIDERSTKLGSVSEGGWVARGDLDLSAYAGRDVTLRLVVSVDDPWSYASYAEAWIDDLEIK